LSNPCDLIRIGFAVNVFTGALAAAVDFHLHALAAPDLDVDGTAAIIWIALDFDAVAVYLNVDGGIGIRFFDNWPRFAADRDCGQKRRR
jgi:hypothetical protein